MDDDWLRVRGLCGFAVKCRCDIEAVTEGGAMVTDSMGYGLGGAVLMLRLDGTTKT